MNDGGGDDLVIEPNIKMMKMVYFIYHIFHHHSSCLCQVPEIWLFLLIQPQQSILLKMIAHVRIAQNMHLGSSLFLKEFGILPVSL